MKLSKEQVRVAERATSVRQLAGQLGATEGPLCYRLKKLKEGPRRYGRADQPLGERSEHLPSGGQGTTDAGLETLGLQMPSGLSYRPCHRWGPVTLRRRASSRRARHSPSANRVYVLTRSR